jgi:hypothetical protein
MPQCSSCDSSIPTGDGSSTDFEVREGNPDGRSVGRIYKEISADGQWFWCLNDRAPSPAADRGYALRAQRRCCC